MYKYDLHHECNSGKDYIRLLEIIVDQYSMQLTELRKMLIKNIKKIGD